MTEDITIIDKYFMDNDNYIVVISGVIPELDKIAEDVANSLNFTYLCFQHINSNYDPVNKRVEDLIKQKKQGIILCGPSFPPDKLGFKIDLHVHVSVNKTMYDELKRDITHEMYIESIKDNYINKYINIKPGYNLEQIGTDIFYAITGNIEKKVY